MVAVWCPDWPAVAARLPPDRPAAVVRANRVVALTEAARELGVRHGERRRAAQSVCPELDLVDDDPDRDAREFEPVIRAVADMAPRLEVVEPGLITVVARGPSRYFGGDRLLAERLAAAVGPIGAVTVGIADGRSAAMIAARVASRGGERTIVVPAGDSARFVGGLPIRGLADIGEASAELVDLLERLGLRTFGALAALDPGDVLARFGVDGHRAHRIASGADDRLPATTDPPPERWAEHSFDEPVQQREAVVFAVKRLADELVAILAGEGRVCTRLVVAFETEHGEWSERAWYRDRGLSAVAMVERARWQLDGWATDALTGGVTFVRLVPDEVRADDGVQSRLWGERSQADTDAGRAITRLSGLAGEAAVCVPTWTGGRLPDERFEWTPAASIDLDDLAERAECRRRSGAPWPGALPTPSPMIVFREPRPVMVVDAAEGSVRVSGRGETSANPAVLVIGGVRHEVTGWAGPWPIDQRWWSPDARRLARFQVLVADGSAHLLAVEQQRWSILATYG
jgi:protein ImuB